MRGHVLNEAIVLLQVDAEGYRCDRLFHPGHRRRSAVDGNADNIRSCLSYDFNLSQGGFDILRAGCGHALHGNGMLCTCVSLACARCALAALDICHECVDLGE